jgi:hypothetical protein
MNFIVFMFMVFFSFLFSFASSFGLDIHTFYEKYMNNFILKGGAVSPMEGRISVTTNREMVL